MVLSPSPQLALYRTNTDDHLCLELESPYDCNAELAIIPGSARLSTGDGTIDGEIPTSFRTAIQDHAGWSATAPAPQLRAHGPCAPCRSVSNELEAKTTPMGSTATDRLQTWRRVAGGLIAAIVLWTYAYARSHGGWPSGHPWSGLTLSLFAVQNLLPLKSKQVTGLVVALAGLGSAVLWVLSLPSASAARSGSSEANGPQQSQSGALLSGSVEAAADTALTEAAKIAASCHPKGAPVGSGKVRVVYSGDGSVQSVEILNDEFRETLTGSCVRMVFRRAKIPAFSGPPTTFIKGFTIPAE